MLMSAKMLPPITQTLRRILLLPCQSRLLRSLLLQSLNILPSLSDRDPSLRKRAIGFTFGYFSTEKAFAGGNDGGVFLVAVKEGAALGGCFGILVGEGGVARGVMVVVMVVGGGGV